MSASPAPPLDHDAAADLLLGAERRREPLEPLTERWPELSLAIAYAVQARLVAHRIEDGERIVGAKLGFTSAAMRESMGIAEPNFGVLTDRMLLGDARLDLDELIHPRVEPELAFRLKRPLRGPGVTAADVLAATDAILPALEVVDSRFRGYRFRLEDNTSDNSSAARVALGQPIASPRVELRAVRVVLERNGEALATATGAAALGNPAAAVAWLANQLAEAERAIEPGDVVISGGLTKAVPIGDGERMTARFDELGSVELDAKGKSSDPADRWGA